jgi:hypothetical protein
MDEGTQMSAAGVAGILVAVPHEISGTVPNLFKLGQHEILKKTSWK